MFEYQGRFLTNLFRAHILLQPTVQSLLDRTLHHHLLRYVCACVCVIVSARGGKVRYRGECGGGRHHAPGWWKGGSGSMSGIRCIWFQKPCVSKALKRLSPFCFPASVSTCRIAWSLIHYLPKSFLHSLPTSLFSSNNLLSVLARVAPCSAVLKRALPDQLDVTLESSKIVKLTLVWVATTHLVPRKCNQTKIMTFIQTFLAESESASPKATTLYVHNMSLFLVACLINKAKQMAWSD